MNKVMFALTQISVSSGGDEAIFKDHASVSQQDAWRGDQGGWR